MIIISPGCGIVFDAAGEVWPTVTYKRGEQLAGPGTNGREGAQWAVCMQDGQWGGFSGTYQHSHTLPAHWQLTQLAYMEHHGSFRPHCPLHSPHGIQSLQWPQKALQLSLQSHPAPVTPTALKSSKLPLSCVPKRRHFILTRGSMHISRGPF